MSAKQPSDIENTSPELLGCRNELTVALHTVFDSPHQLEAALGLVREIVSREVTPLVEGSPSVRRGDVLYHVTAS